MRTSSRSVGNVKARCEKPETLLASTGECDQSICHRATPAEKLMTSGKLRINDRVPFGLQHIAHATVLGQQSVRTIVLEQSGFQIEFDGQFTRRHELPNQPPEGRSVVHFLIFPARKIPERARL